MADCIKEIRQTLGLSRSIIRKYSCYIIVVKSLSRNINQEGFHIIEVLFIISVLTIVTLTGLYIYKKHQQTISGPSSKPLSRIVGSFSIVGNKIIGPNGKQFIPYGVVLECPANKKDSISDICTGKDITQNTGEATINAAAKSWSMNIMRFQVAQEHLFNQDGSVNSQYIGLVDKLVKQANNLGMVVTITLQEEQFSGPAFPTATSIKFWQYMANHYKTYNDVFFDLYNEPRLGVAAAGTMDNVWNLWQNGGIANAATNEHKISTDKMTYVGMQSLVNTIRGEGANNIIIAEGPNSDKDLSGVPTHQLTGGNIAYGVEPNLHMARTQADQYNYFGQYTKKWVIMPEAFLDNVGTQSCDPKSPTELPKLLDYVKSLNMGFMFWSLVPGAGIIGTDLNHPTSYPDGATSIASPDCPHKGKDALSPSNTIGDGAIIQQFYKANSIQL